MVDIAAVRAAVGGRLVVILLETRAEVVREL
jgi:hypothetical protein